MRNFDGLFLALVLCFNCGIIADEVTLSRNGKESKLSGKVLEEAQNGEKLFQTRDGRIWELDPEEIVEIAKSADEIKPMSKLEVGRQLRDEMGEGFRIHETRDFVLVYNTEENYARWIGGLYNRLSRGFCNYWKGKNGFKLAKKTKFPLPVLIFKSQLEYRQYMKRDLGMVNPAMLAYYNIETNRVAMFDLTADKFQGNGKLDNRKIAKVLNNPRAIPMVATVIHEGTHQLMFNYGMQVRYSDTPLWINEGLAMYFETPDLSSERGWRKIGQINFLRYQPFLQYLQRRPDDSLRKMIQDDSVFRGDAAADNYCQAWAFNYFLLEKHKKNFAKYLKHMSQKPVLRFDTPEQRVEEFEEILEVDLASLDREFVRYMLQNRISQRSR